MNELYLKKLSQSALKQLEQVYEEVTEQHLDEATTHMMIPMALLNESTADFNNEYKVAFDQFIQRLAKVHNNSDIHVDVDISSNEALTNLDIALTVTKRSQLHQATSLLQNVTK